MLKIQTFELFDFLLNFLNFWLFIQNLNFSLENFLAGNLGVNWGKQNIPGSFDIWKALFKTPKNLFFVNRGQIDSFVPLRNDLLNLIRAELVYLYNNLILIEKLKPVIWHEEASDELL